VIDLEVNDLIRLVTKFATALCRTIPSVSLGLVQMYE
jgi:hypothetical protein